MFTRYQRCMVTNDIQLSIYTYAFTRYAYTYVLWLMYYKIYRTRGETLKEQKSNNGR